MIIIYYFFFQYIKKKLFILIIIELKESKQAFETFILKTIFFFIKFMDFIMKFGCFNL